jgi:hypothetical protein
LDLPEVGQSFNTIFGTTSNLWDLSSTPGGSSSGNAAALAAGLTHFSVGSDVAEGSAQQLRVQLSSRRMIFREARPRHARAADVRVDDVVCSVERLDYQRLPVR